MLRRAYLFEDLDDGDFEGLSASTRETELAADQWLCFHGDPATSVYLVLEGEIALLRNSETGDEVIVALVGPGELFGEDLVLVEEACHPLSARALSLCRIAEIDKERLRLLAERDPRLLRRLLLTLQRRNSILLDEIESLTIQSASERLLAFLESRPSAAAGEPLRISKRVLASRLAIRPETLSRILGQLKACDRIREVDGCLMPIAEGSTSPCAICPARLWGCPGPKSDRELATARTAALAAD